METSKDKICPFLMSNLPIIRHCLESRCAWWCGFAQDCAVPLLTWMLACNGNFAVKFYDKDE